MTVERFQVEVKPLNWLPLPGELTVEEVPSVAEDDLFTKGSIERYYPRQRYGHVKNDRGETIVFRLTELNLVGPKGHAKYLKQGCRVGYDIAWTSHGLHITRMKIY